jgi:hypothetical protein
MSKKVVLILLSLFWIWFTLGFIFMGGILHVLNGIFRGEGRELMCGSMGCSDFEYILSLIWLYGQVMLIVTLPILIIYLYRKKK